MGLQFIRKRDFKHKTIHYPGNIVVEDLEPKDKTDGNEINISSEETTISKNNSKKKKNDMITEEQVNAAENAAMAMANSVKVVKQDRGLIERTESSKIILTEDNRQVLND